jgi:UMF1 family MFS transporter
LAWCLYDWANSAFPTVIITFIFAVYFTKGVAVDEITGTGQWGYAMGLSALAVAVVGPVLGAIADQAGRRKPWLALFTVVAAAAATALWTVAPHVDFVWRALFLVALANFAFEMGMVFYNAMLPDLVPGARMGRWSGWGWGLGYAGGLCCLAFMLLGFVQTETPLFGLDKTAAEHLRISGPVVGIWMLVFAVPLFVLTPDTPATGKPLAVAVSAGLKSLWATLRQVSQYGNVTRFLLARMIYTDGLNTLFAFGGIYAAGTFGMSFEDLIILGVALNVTAGLGAVGFSWVDDRIGSKPTIFISLIGLTGLSAGLLMVETQAMFWAFSLPLGLFMGPAQSASRTLMARLAPHDLRTEFFGLYALSGKATAFLGPAILAVVTVATGSQRAGMATILIFFIVGMALLIKVSDTRE